MAYSRAKFFPRLLAAIIDGIIGAVPFLIPIVGMVLGIAYLLSKDALIYQISKKDKWKNRSIGKKLLNLKVVTDDGHNIDFLRSAKRNLTLTAGSLISLIPLLGWAVGPIVGLILAVIELILVLVDKQGRRLGDRWADTQVVDIASAQGIDRI